MEIGWMLNMILRIVTRRAVELGVNKAIDVAARGGKAAAEMTAAEKAAAKSARQNVGRVRKAMRFARRLMR